MLLYRMEVRLMMDRQKDKRFIRTSFTIERTTNAALKNESERTGYTMSEIADKALERYFTEVKHHD